MSKKATVMSGLALLAAGVSLVLTIQEKKRSQKRNAAVCDYVNAECSSVLQKAGERIKECIDKVEDRLKDLEAGVIPDYEEARKAANAMNDFNKGVANIWGFDPIAALKREQTAGKTGEEDK